MRENIRGLVRFLTILMMVMLVINLLPVSVVQAATYRTWIAQVPANPDDNDTVRIWMNSDTAVGETAGVEYHNITAGTWTKVLGTYDNSSYPGANWYADIPALPAGTQVEYQLFTRNEFSTDYGFSGFNWNYTVIPTVVYVDDDYTSATSGWGVDHFAVVQNGIDAVAPDGTVNVAAGTYTEAGQKVISKNLTIQGEDRLTTILKPGSDTVDSGDTGSWILVNEGVTLNLSGVTLDGDGRQIRQALRFNGSGVVDTVIIKNMVYPGYSGFAIAQGYTNTTARTLEVKNSTFTNFGRVGIQADEGSAPSVATISNNTFTGKGLGDQLDYAITVEGGAEAIITGNTITNCLGTAISDGSTSAAISITTYFAPGSTAIILRNSLTGNTTGIAVGFDGTDTSSVVAHFNRIAGNDYGITSTAPAVDAENNWWGCNEGPTGTDCDSADTEVDADPWLVMSISSLPASLDPGSAFAFSADLTDNSTPADAGDFLPASTAVDFSPTAYVDPDSDPLTSGIAETLVTIPVVPASFQVCATLDNESLCSATIQVDQPTITYADDDWASLANGTVVTVGAGNHIIGYDAFDKIQEAADAVTAGGMVNVGTGTYIENVVVNKSLEIAGAGQANVFVQPAVSAANPCVGSSLCGGAASNVFLIRANDVKIHDLTVDGDNPALTGGINVGGANIDARNGIIVDHSAGSFTNTQVDHVTIRNIYLRGFNASSGGSFYFTNNTVDNVQGDTSTIAIFGWYGPGVFATNTVSNVNDGLAVNHSRGVQILDNTITNAATGIHTDNAGDGGGAADIIRGNTIDACKTNGYGIFVFVPYLAPTVDQNTITDCEVGLSAWGQGVATTTVFSNNVVDGPDGSSTSVGVYITTDLISWGYTDVAVDFHNNIITDNAYMLYLTGDQQSWNPGVYATHTITATFYGNNFMGNASGVSMGTQGAYVVDASGNWWGSNIPATVRAAANGGTLVDYTPWLDAGTDTSVNMGFQGDFSTLWVDDDSLQIATIGRVQEGVNMSADGALSAGARLVNVLAGTYTEDLVIGKAITLRGPNELINPNTGTREAEAIVHPATSAPNPSVCNQMVYVSVGDVTIKGFTFDGDNPAITSGVTIGSMDVDACEIIASWEGVGNIVVENNILKGATYAGLEFYNYVNPAATAGNYLRNNLIENIGETTYNWGLGILIYNNFYADITGNVMNTVRVGIQTGNYSAANPGTTGRISNNTFNVWRLGIFHNLWYSNASTISVDNNTINAISYPGATKWNGILISSFNGSANTTIADNIINIPGTVTFAAPGYTAGFNVWNNNTTAPLVIHGGAVTGGDYGVWVNNYEGYSGNAGNTFVTLDGITIDGAGIGVNVWDSPSNTNSATVSAILTNNQILNTETAVQVSGSDASAVVGGTSWADGNTLESNTLAVSISSGSAVVKGNIISNNTGVFDQSGGTLTAYANSITGYTTGRSGSGGTTSLKHNWWGSSSPTASMPAGLVAADWQARLGAHILDWAEADYGVVGLSLGGAAVQGGLSGKLQIVDHGYGSASDSRPFGNGIEPFASQMCSNFYDVFAVDGSGTYDVSLAVNAGAACDPRLADQAVYWIPATSDYTTDCSSASTRTCWDGVVLSHTITTLGRTLVIAGLTPAELGGTQFVVGDINGLDPTAIQLVNLEAHPVSGSLPGVMGVVLGVVALLGAAMVVRRRK